MESSLIMVDTSVLIDLFRKTDKNNAALISLVRAGYRNCISAITEYEIYTGTSTAQTAYWNEFLVKTQVLPFSKSVAQVAVEINRDLKRKRKLIAIPDLFIAATAMANNLPIATLNKKHFERINGLSIVN